MVKEGISPPSFSEVEIEVIERLIAGTTCKEPNLLAARVNLRRRYGGVSGTDPLLLAVAEAAEFGLVNFDNLPDRPADFLNERQGQIWQLFRQGCNYQEIAKIFETSPKSIHSTIFFLLCRLGVNNRFGAVAMMIKMEQNGCH